ncbi:hypothetical protein ABIE19_002442 [Brevundimonas faecalis]|uniref:Uncharacterized protein n=2 Tax=Brevundimonas faecalis TaxID=947378 RepID=A0ABV2RDJ0_9CAUL
MTIEGGMKSRTRWLALTASPLFAVMAVLSAFDPHPMALCSSSPGMLPGDGMTLMYGLMSLFHLPVWLDPAGRG